MIMLDDLKKTLQSGQKIELHIKVNPKSGKHQIASIMSDGTIKIQLKSTPENNKANIELIELLSEYFNIHHSKISIISGETSRQKTIHIQP